MNYEGRFRLRPQSSFIIKPFIIHNFTNRIGVYDSHYSLTTAYSRLYLKIPC